MAQNQKRELSLVGDADAEVYPSGRAPSSSDMDPVEGAVIVRVARAPDEGLLPDDAA